jgi:hypothetical protein|tara:strand:+ start:1625 stop:2383 length:759 start_codon:yes stop_codon:yes gene_type:complete
MGESKSSFKYILIIGFIIIFLVVGFFIAKSFLPAGVLSKKPTVHNAVYECTNDNSISSKGYVYLHGLGDHNPGILNDIKALINQDPILDFDYNEKLLLNEISNDFILQFSKFASQNNFEEIVIIGQSAGGVIASFSAHQLNFNGVIELHTLASPINGYHVSDKFLGELSGFAREIGEGFDSFTKPGNNFKIYHHKTVVDEDLSSLCGEFAKFCSPLSIQDNNIEGSNDFYYSEYDHTSIMPAVSKMIIECHN